MKRYITNIDEDLKIDLERIRKYVYDKFDIFIPLCEINYLWECFSQEYYAGFMIVDNETLKNFTYYLRGELNV